MARKRYTAEEIIGKLPRPTMPLNPLSRLYQRQPRYTAYEVRLDVYPDVFASGLLLLPKGIRRGGRRPVVVCQHGLELGNLGSRLRELGPHVLEIVLEPGDRLTQLSPRLLAGREASVCREGACRGRRASLLDRGHGLPN